MQIVYLQSFEKQLQVMPQKIRESFMIRLSLFARNPFDVLLHNHKLKGKFKGYRSINITGDWRAVYKQQGDTVIFVALGTNSKLYK